MPKPQFQGIITFPILFGIVAAIVILASAAVSATLQEPSGRTLEFICKRLPDIATCKTLPTPTLRPRPTLTPWPRISPRPKISPTPDLCLGGPVGCPSPKRTITPSPASTPTPTPTPASNLKI